MIFEVRVSKLRDLPQGGSEFILMLIDLQNPLRVQAQACFDYYQSAITATISHEQLNPLNSIINVAESLDLRSITALEEGTYSMDPDKGEDMITVKLETLH